MIRTEKNKTRQNVQWQFDGKEVEDFERFGIRARSCGSQAILI